MPMPYFAVLPRISSSETMHNETIRLPASQSTRQALLYAVSLYTGFSLF